MKTVASISVVFVLFSVLLMGVFGGPLHTFTGTVFSEEYVITLVTEKVNQSWSITDWTRNKNNGKIVKAIDIYAHGVSHSNKKPKLPSSPGYRGYVIHHMVNGGKEHDWILPKCRLPKLETAILQYTANKTVKAEYTGALKSSASSC